MDNKGTYRSSYNQDAVNRAINRERARGHYISKREAQMIHAILKGRE